MSEQNKIGTDRIRSYGEYGMYDMCRWIEEASSRLTSAKILRGISQEKEKELKEYSKNNDDSGRHINKYVHPWESTLNSSFLLLGYAIELLLKAGIVSLCANLPKSILDNQLKHYGHKLIEISKVLHVSLSDDEEFLLTQLASFIVHETRYPLGAKSLLDYCSKKNNLSVTLSNDSIFDTGISIYEKIWMIIADIDGTQNSPRISFRIDIDDDGFLTYRNGGSIPPVCILNYSSRQIQLSEDNLDALKVLIQNNSENNPKCWVLLNSWDDMDLYSVKQRSDRLVFQKAKRT